MNKILIIQTASLGDVILSTSLAESIHARFPEAAIDYLVKKGYKSLFNGHPFIRKVYVWDKKQGKYKNLLHLAISIRAAKYDAVINVQRFFSSGFLTAFSGAPVRAGFNKNPLSFAFTHKVKHLIGTEANGLHETERNHRLLGAFENIRLSKPGLYPSQVDYDSIKEWSSPKYITIAPTSLWFTKQYPIHKWVEFISNIPADIRVILLGAKEDAGACESILRQITHPDVINLAGKPDFLQSAALMKNAVMNFVNDSAPMHLASAVNAPVTAIFCSTVPAFGFGPLSDNAEIAEAIPAPACRPCGLHGLRACPLGHFNCAETIKAEQLLHRLKS